MANGHESERDLKHALENERAKTKAAQHLLKRAADELDDLAEADCAEEQKLHALRAADHFRRAASA